MKMTEEITQSDFECECGEKFGEMEVVNGRNYCFDCFNDAFKKCDYCEELLDYDLVRNGSCEKCFRSVNERMP